MLLSISEFKIRYYAPLAVIVVLYGTSTSFEET